MNHMTQPHRTKGLTEPFVGFALPTSNTTWTMNQFFDVCLPYRSRGATRLVGALIRWTIGWCDSEGRPQQERHVVSYAEFQRAGVGRDSIKDAVREAIDAHLIRCVREPQVQRAGQPAVSGLYELMWDDGLEYVKDPSRFRGFFAGEGNRTPIPDQFFDVVLPNETLAVIKVVGAIIRFSIGFTTKWGHRRQLASLSYEDIRRYTKMNDRTSLSAAIRTAMEKNYIRRAEEGYFDPNGGMMSRSAVYALKWLSDSVEAPDGRKTRPAESGIESRSGNPTGNGRKSRPAQRSENPTDIQITKTKDIFKQQPAVSVEGTEAADLLRSAGFDERTAEELSARYSAHRIAQQIEWLPKRAASRNPLGMLRRSIEEDWKPPQTPASAKLGRPNSPAGESEQEHARREKVRSQVAELSRRYRV